MQYIDIVVLVVLLVFVIIYSKKFQTYMFGFGLIDVLFRIINIINGYIPVKNVSSFIKTYVPASIPGIVDKYTSGVLNIILMWVYVAVMLIFLYFVLKIFIKRKKI